MSFIGERLKDLLRTAGPKARIELHAPFIKYQVLETLLSLVPDSCEVTVCTRWLPREVAAGVSDLDVFQLCMDRPNTNLRLNDQLHAKLYLSDEVALIGSANLTARALGWCESSPNIESLSRVHVSDKEVARVRALSLGRSREATFNEHQEIAEAAARFETPRPDDAVVPTSCNLPWMPASAVPTELYATYVADEKPETMVQTAYQDLQDDLSFLMLPPGLGRTDFKQLVAHRLGEMHLFSSIIARIPDQISDEDGQAIIQNQVPGLTGALASGYWRVLRLWIEAFFDEVEVVARDHILRTKSVSSLHLR